MKQNFTKLLTTSLIAGVFIFTGCGDDAVSKKDSINSSKPHKVIRVLEGADLPSNYEDFAAKIEMSAELDDSNMRLWMEGDNVVTWDMAHMQVYIDIDNDEKTGLSMGSGNYAIVGADYMVEDTQLFKSTSDSDWEWEYVGDVENILDYEGLPLEDYTPEHNGGKISDHYSKHVKIDTDLLEGINKKDAMKIRVSMEPIDKDWADTDNYVPVKTVTTSYKPQNNNFPKARDVTADGRYGMYVEGASIKYLKIVDTNMNIVKKIVLHRYSVFEKAEFVGNNKFIYRIDGDKEDTVVSF